MGFSFSGEEDESRPAPLNSRTEGVVSVVVQQEESAGEKMKKRERFLGFSNPISENTKLPLQKKFKKI